jgi:hypothetical protein
MVGDVTALEKENKGIDWERIGNDVESIVIVAVGVALGLLIFFKLLEVVS